MKYLDVLKAGPLIFQNPPPEGLTELTNGASVSFGSDPCRPFPENKATPTSAEPFEPLLTQRANLDTLLTEACQGVEGIDAAIFRSLLSPEDVQDIEGGYIPMVTLNAYAKSFAEGIRCGRITVLAAVIRNVMLTSRVRSADCQHFERDTVGDGNGIGWCRVQGEGTGQGQPALWPRVDRACRDFTE